MCQKHQYSFAALEQFCVCVSVCVSSGHYLVEYFHHRDIFPPRQS